MVTEQMIMVSKLSVSYLRQLSVRFFNESFRYWRSACCVPKNGVRWSDYYCSPQRYTNTLLSHMCRQSPRHALAVLLIGYQSRTSVSK